MLEIVQAPHPALSAVAKRINKIDKTILDLIEEMTYTLVHTTDPEGVGLAAPQVAESLQLFVVKESPEAPRLVFINPEIKEQSQEHLNLDADEEDTSRKKKSRKKDKGVKLEGCLSLKDIWGIVHRSQWVVLSYQDESGKQFEKKFDGFMATIIQHEVDHLHGVLFPKRVLEQKEKLYKTSTDEDGETVFEELAI
jgi:peptide deformylase